jgi:hypothetical protein
MKRLFAVLAFSASAWAQAPAVAVKAVKPPKGSEFPKFEASSPAYEIQGDCDAATLKAVALMLEDLRRGFTTEFKDLIENKEITQEKFQVRFYKTQKAMQGAMQMPMGMGPGGPGGGPGGPGGGAPKGGPPMGGGGPGGYYDPGSKTLHSCLEQPGGDDWQFVLKHEGTHQLLHLILGIGGGQPGVTSAIWFNEGFASYWATMKWKGKQVVTGDVVPKLLDEFRRMSKSDTLMPVKQMIGGMPNPMMMKAYYSQGWALCHFLRHGKYKEKFVEYMKKEKAGKIKWEDFAEAVGVKDAEEFEKEWIRHVEGLK